MSTKKKTSARKSHKKAPPVDVWWKSVSTYKTPFWQKDKKAHMDSLAGFDWLLKSADGYGCESSGKSGINPRTLKLSYSFDRLREAKQKKETSKPSEEDGQAEIEALNREEETKKTDQSNQQNQTKDESLDLKALDVHGIVYKYQPGQGHEFTKINTTLESEVKDTVTTKNPEVTSTDVTEPQDTAKEPHDAAKEPQDAAKESPDAAKETLDVAKETTTDDQKTDSVPNVKPILACVVKKWKPKKKPIIPMPPDNELLAPEQKCSDFLTSDKSRSFMAQPNDLSTSPSQTVVGAQERFFESNVPDDFPLLCLAALRDFVVRSETVITSKTYEKIESLTVNRTPLCSYGRREQSIIR
uniref:Uncharacterized protein LOC100180673 n=1 Tax=Phallusia mammillata TaxID=59560 RepID=A0A6F9DHH4_9ASCI|nr:uncharacterized protein LOC100180673 [Phallusia mammillata]